MRRLAATGAQIECKKGGQPKQMNTCKVIELGMIGYGAAFRLQRQLVAARKTGAAPNVLLLCEHPHVITLGRNGRVEHVRVADSALRQMGVEFHHTDRGGDITYHGPGQIVGYPILQLNEIRRDVGWYVRQLEQAMIFATAAFGIAAFRIAGRTGVWVTPPAAADDEQPRVEEKLAAIGVHISRWVTSHGFAYNVTTDLRYFDLIVPCGIADRSATSLVKLLGRPVATADVTPHLIAGMGSALGLEMITATREELDEWLSATAEPAGVAV